MSSLPCRVSAEELQHDIASNRRVIDPRLVRPLDEFKEKAYYWCADEMIEELFDHSHIEAGKLQEMLRVLMLIAGHKKGRVPPRLFELAQETAINMYEDALESLFIQRYGKDAA